MLLEMIERTFLISHSQWNFLSFTDDKEWKRKGTEYFGLECSSCLR